MENTLVQSLVQVQAQLKAPKAQRNNFGKYNYRSCEDILEAVKPLLLAQGLMMTITDEVTEIAGMPMISATVTVKDASGEVSVSAQAGIDPNRKGMDIAQSFGSSSSYARKYALNGMFLIDDTKDADATNDHGKKTTTAKASLVENSQAYAKVAAALKSGAATMAQVESKYVVSSELKEKLNNL
tara:strand:+ start:3708 stop:4259 length:552 start_codon:yes stop_codon:yes gene_type:complete